MYISRKCLCVMQWIMIKKVVQQKWIRRFSMCMVIDVDAGDERENEYIQKAIELGAKEIVFTDHAPFPGNSFNYRMEMEELKEYVGTLKVLQQQYKGMIEIKVGLEIEYIPTYIDYYRELKEKWKLSILLLGQHFSLLADGSYTFDLE